MDINTINKNIAFLQNHPCIAALGRVGSSMCHASVSDGGMVWREEILSQFRRYIELIAQWNALSGLVSPQDMSCLAERHFLDALSLVPYVAAGNPGDRLLLDIGSGGGFPSIPIKLALPAIGVTLVERNTRKAAFLEMVAGALGLKDVSILHGEFPAVRPDRVPSHVTARAVEKPKRILKSLRGYLPTETSYLCQFRSPETVLGPMFHVERIEDEWTHQGWRRGSLALVRRK